MLYTDDFIVTLPNNFEEAALAVVERWWTSSPSDEDSQEAIELFTALCRKHVKKYDLKITTEIMRRETLTALRNILQKQHRASKYDVLLGSVFHYELSDADLKRIQNLIDDLRSLIQNSDEIDEEYRRRLLLRLENLQKELHKRVSDVHHIYGLIGDAGVLAGKLGTSAKPLVDRIREILQIAWRSEASAENLPASAPPALLSPPSEDKSGS